MICEYCGKEFEGRKKKYCSRECCRSADRDNKRIKYVWKSERAPKCLLCGGELSQGQQKYCSKDCRRRYQSIYIEKRCFDHGELTKTCSVCGKEFKTWKSQQKCCSPECSKNRKKECTENQRQKRKEYDRQRWLELHPDASTAKEIHERKLAREAEREAERECKRKEREAELQKIRAHKKAIKQANIDYWLNYEAEHECCFCGNSFIAHHPTAKYCSRTCARNSTRIKDRYKGITIDKGITLPKLAERDHNQCQICGLFVDWNDYIATDKTIICGNMYPSIDHIRPISKGGKHAWDNVQLAHRHCNTVKSNKLIG